MADVPDGIVLKRHRDLEGVRRSGIWVRRACLALIAVVSLLGLANVFGQRPSTLTANGSAATLAVYAPSAIRGGDFMEARFHIKAKRDLKQAILKLDPGWAEGMSWNSAEPSPSPRPATTAASRSISAGSRPGTRSSSSCSSRSTRRTSPGTGRRTSSSTTATRCSPRFTGRSRSSPRPWISFSAPPSSSRSCSC